MDNQPKTDSAPPSPQGEAEARLHELAYIIEQGGRHPEDFDWETLAADIRIVAKALAPASPAPHDTLRLLAEATWWYYGEGENEWLVCTRCLRRVEHREGVTPSINDHEPDCPVRAALAAQPTTTEIPAELGVGSSGGDEVLREAAHALALLPRHLPWSDTCSKCGGITFISPDVLRSIHAEALGVVETTLASCTGGAAKCPGGPWVNGGDDEHGLFADPPGGESQ